MNNISKIELTNFRRFNELVLPISNKNVLIIGNNALGKTTILEAIYFCLLTKSHKTSDYIDLITYNKEFCHVKITARKTYEIICSNKGKKVFINRIEKRKLSEYVGDLKVILFSPEDLNIVKGSPSLRREFMDIQISQVNKSYLFELSNYKRILKQRKELLKTLVINSDKTLLNIITEQLEKSCQYIVKERKKFIDELNLILLNQSISDESIRISYEPSIYDNMLEMLKSKMDQDIISKTNNLGAHRDELVFFINEEKSKFLSQGQQRTIILAIKLALINYFKNKTGDYPIILLDDVLSELDEKRQKKLLGCINNESQIFITTTNVFNIELMKDYQVIRINQEGVKVDG